MQQQKSLQLRSLLRKLVDACEQARDVALQSRFEAGAHLIAEVVLGGQCHRHDLRAFAFVDDQLLFLAFTEVHINRKQRHSLCV